MASLGALRRFDDQGQWLTMGHALVHVPDEAALAGLVVDAEPGQVVWAMAEETLWVFDGTTHVKVGSEPVGVFSIVSIPNVDKPNGYMSIYDLYDDKVVPVGAVAILQTSVGFSSTQLPTQEWYDLNKVNIIGPTWVNIPKGTFVQKTATGVVRERYRPGNALNIYAVTFDAGESLTTGFLGLTSFLDDAKAPVESIGVLSSSVAINTTLFPNLQWFDVATRANINGAQTITLPAGTIIQKTATNVLRERHKPVAGGLVPIDAADEAKAIAIGAFAIATEDLDLAPADFTGWTWITEFTGSIAMSGGTVPAGTIVERTGQTEITERSRPAVMNIMESDSVAGDFGFDLDWINHERYEVVISTAGAVSFRASTAMDWWGSQTSSLGGISQFNVTGPTNTFKQIIPTGQLRLTLVRVGSGIWSFVVGAGVTNVPGVGNVHEFIEGSGYLSGTRPTRVDFRLASATNSISVVAYGRRG